MTHVRRHQPPTPSNMWRAARSATVIALFTLMSAAAAEGDEAHTGHCGEYLHETSKATWEVAPSSIENAVAVNKPGFHHYFKESFANETAWTKPDDPYVWATPEDDRLAGQLMRGDPSRLRLALHRHLVEKKNLTVVFIGGSITLGSSPDGLSYPQWFEVILRKTEPFKSAAAEGRLNVINAASAGTSSSYMCLCHRLRLPPDVDIVFVEYAKNDAGSGGLPLHDNPLRRTYERLIRKLLQYRNAPAIIVMSAFVWENPPMFYSIGWTVERELNEFSAYYRLPTISVKTAVFHLCLAGVPGFHPNGTRRQDDGSFDDTLIGKLFFMDKGAHPDPHTGYRVMGELAAQHVLDAAAGTPYTPVTQNDKARATKALPIPMIQNNYESPAERCLVEHLFHDVVDSSDNWIWTDEGRNKWGYVSHQVGALIRVHVDTRLPGVPAHLTGKEHMSTLRVAFLRSYEHMGHFRVTCESGCTCDSELVNTHVPGERVSLMKMHRMHVTQSENCKLAIENAPNTTSGEHKVKILGIMVSEDPPEIASQHEYIDIHAARDTDLHKDGLYIGRRIRN